MKIEIELEKINEMLHVMRKSRKLTLPEAQKRAGISSMTIHKIEKKGAFPHLKTLNELQKLYNYKITFLISDNVQTIIFEEPEKSLENAETKALESLQENNTVTNNNAA